MPWSVLQQRGRVELTAADRLHDRVDESSLTDAATIVYTSGTTGSPKGAVLTHANIAFTVKAVTSVVSVGPPDRFLSFLPLSHIAERIVSHFGQIAAGCETWFARSLATVAEDMYRCRPTIFFAVPRIWEKLRDAIIEESERRHRVQRMALARFIALGTARARAQAAGSPIDAFREVQWRLLNRVVGTAVRRKLGLDAARVLVSGAAPISSSLVGWFQGIGLPIGEVYGQTEDCGPATVHAPPITGSAANHVGSVGRSLPGIEVRAGSDGEILIRGGSVSPGYWHNPSATADLIDVDGWMHSGDLGRIDDDGYLWITGRKKDLIINAAGHNIAPQPIETRLGNEPLILSAVVVGDRHPYLAALITLDPQQLAGWAERHHKRFDLEALAQDPDVHAAVDEAIQRVNAEVARVEGIKRFRILPAPFAAATGELTPTLKVKRNVVIAKYSALVDEMYADEG